MSKKIHPLITQLIEVRKEQKLSQERLVAKATENLAQNQISSYERGTCSPSLRLLNVWAGTLGYELTLRRIEEK